MQLLYWNCLFSLDLDETFIPQAENREWGKCAHLTEEAQVRRKQIAASEKARTYCFYGTQQIPFAGLQFYPTAYWLCLLLVLLFLWRFLSYLSFRLDSHIVLILGLNPKFVQKLHLHLKPNDHPPLQYFMYLSR